MCPEHATAFWTGAVQVAAATSRLYRADPDMLPTALCPNSQPAPHHYKTIRCRVCRTLFLCSLDQARNRCEACRTASKTRRRAKINEARRRRKARMFLLTIKTPPV